MNEKFNQLWPKVKELAKTAPYIYGSDFYAHRDAAAEVAKELPEEERRSFMDFIAGKIKNYSNYSGD